MMVSPRNLALARSCVPHHCVVWFSTFLIVAAALFLLWRRSVRKGEDPEFKGPVYTVDYEEVEDEEE